jgi:steroid delta-isomerase-like uncharacterized protein
MDIQDDAAIVRRFFDEVCNGRKLDVADELFSVDHVCHDPSSPSIGPGPEGQKQLVATYQRAFGDAHWTVEEMLVAGSAVVTRWTGRGTHTGELMGLPITGKSVVVSGIWIHRLAGNKIVESWDVWDTLGMLEQLGVVPQIATAKT